MTRHDNPGCVLPLVTGVRNVRTGVTSYSRRGLFIDVWLVKRDQTKCSATDGRLVRLVQTCYSVITRRIQVSDFMIILKCLTKDYWNNAALHRHENDVLK